MIPVAQSILGVALPLSPLTSVEQGDLVVRWIAPDEWLISLPNDQVFDLETRFRAEMTGHHSLVNGSGGMTVYKLRGKHVVDMLKKSTPVDLHDSEFPVGKVVSTVFAKAGLLFGVLVSLNLSWWYVAVLQITSGYGFKTLAKNTV